MAKAKAAPTKAKKAAPKKVAKKKPCKTCNTQTAPSCKRGEGLVDPKSSPVRPARSARVELPRFKSWSISRLKDYEKCPQYACYRHLMKNELGEEPKGAPLQRGIDIHEEAEAFLKGKLKAVPESLKKFEGDFIDLRRNGAESELKWAFDDAWRPVEYFAKNAWVRVVADAYLLDSIGTARLIDFKTGKAADYSDQLDLYAVAAFQHNSTTLLVSGELWFLDHGIKSRPAYYKPEAADKLRKKWGERVRPMFADTKFVPRPGPYCKWCFYSKAKGGPCKF